MKKNKINIILGGVLVFSIIFSIIRVIKASAPDPGHTWSEIGDVIVSASQGGTGLASIGSSNQILRVNTAGNALEYNTLDTSLVPENGNLYYTDARVSANADVVANTLSRHDPVTIGTTNGLSISGQSISLGLADGSTSGALSSSDWNTFSGKESSITAGTVAQYFRGDKTFQTLDTSIVPENTNLYYTDTRVDFRITAQKAVANGLATLDGSGTIPISQMPSAILGSVIYQGVWDAGSNLPALSSGTGTKGDYYIVSVVGSTSLDAVSNWDIGDWAVFNGTAWEKIDNTDSVSSVNGYTGVINLTKSDLGLANVENTTLSSWIGTSNITTLGTINSGTWNGSAVDVAYGGTGATTATAGFNTLSPLTSKGDILASDGTNNIRVVAGSNSQILVADSTQVSGLKWVDNTGYIIGQSISSTVNAGATRYGSFMGIGSFSATELPRVFIVPTGGTVKNLYIRTSSAQPASGSLTVTVRKNSADTSLQVVIPASASANSSFSDTSNSFAVSAGDLLSLKFVNSASAASANILNYSVFVQ